ncbi:MAG: glycosyltransferase family 39 protein [Myxococcota bacterium]
MTSDPCRYPRQRWLDGATYLLAAAMGAPSLAYPHGADTATFAYVGRVWTEGVWPYSGAVDQKPPAIYLLHALATVLFGGGPWVIRLLEIAAVLGCGWLVGKIVAREDEPTEGGIAALLMAGFYYICFDFWETGESEIWQALFLVASWAVLAHRKTPRRLLTAGALAGVAVLFKYPAGLVAVGIAATAVELDRRTVPGLMAKRALVTLAWFGAGSLIVIVPTALVFVASGDFADLVEITILFNLEYARVKLPGIGAAEFWLLHGLVFTAAGALAYGSSVWRAVTAREWSEIRFAAVSAGLLFLAMSTVTLQGKLFGYHWAIIMPFWATCTLWGLRRLVPRFWVRGALVVMVVGGGLGLAPAWHINPAWDYRAHVSSLLDYLWGTQDRWSYLEPFHRAQGRRYDYRTQERLAARVTARAEPGDTLCVFRGHEPAIYNLTGMHCPSRFFAEYVLTFPHFARSKRWFAEHRATLRASPPTFFVAELLDEHLVESNMRVPYDCIAAMGANILLRRAETNSRCNLEGVLTEWEMTQPLPAEAGGVPPNVASLFDAGVDSRTVSTESGLVDLGRFFAPCEGCSVFVRSVFRSPTQRAGAILVSADDPVDLWLNGEPIFAGVANLRDVTLDQYRVGVSFVAGTNEIVLRVWQLTGRWGFGARVENAPSSARVGRSPRSPTTSPRPE